MTLKNTLNRLGRFDEAIASFNQSLRHSNPNAKAWYGRAITAALQGDSERTAENLKAAISAGGDSYRIRASQDRNFRAVRSSKEVALVLQTH